MQGAVRRFFLPSVAVVAWLVAGCAAGAPGTDPSAKAPGAMERPSNPAARVSPTVNVSGAVNKPMTVDLAALQALPATQQTMNGTVYTGVSLWALLSQSAGGIKTGGASGKNPTIAMYIVATGSDGYRAVLSLAEIDPNFGNKAALVAYSVDGKPLDRSGMARLVVPGDVKAARSVSNLSAIEVVALPAAR